jgi:hypothetical protein
MPSLILLPLLMRLYSLLYVGWKTERWAFRMGASDVGLCEKAYCTITGIALSTFQNWKRQVRMSEQPAITGRKPGQRSAKTEAARAFMVHYAAAHDYSPNETCSKNGLTLVSVGVGSV